MCITRIENINTSTSKNYRKCVAQIRDVKKQRKNYKKGYNLLKFTKQAPRYLA